MLDPKPVPNFIPPIDIGKEPPDTDMETKVRYVYELVGDKQTFSHTKVLITLHEAASLILSYTNRTQLPKELDWMQVRIAADLLLYRTPDVDRDGGPNADPLMDNLKRIRQDDVEFEAKDKDDTYVLSMDKNNANVEFLKDYALLLQMWRLMPRGGRRGHC